MESSHPIRFELQEPNFKGTSPTARSAKKLRMGPSHFGFWAFQAERMTKKPLPPLISWSPASNWDSQKRLTLHPSVFPSVTPVSHCWMASTEAATMRGCSPDRVSTNPFTSPHNQWLKVRRFYTKASPVCFCVYRSYMVFEELSVGTGQMSRWFW